MRLDWFEDSFTIFFEESLHAWQKEADFAHGHFGFRFSRLNQSKQSQNN